MRSDKTAQDTYEPSIPGEFRENYRFLRELINCKEKNNRVTSGLEALVANSPDELKARLNRRQGKIMRDFVGGLKVHDPDCLNPPVPAELEASIRVRKRSTWLPWEAEAIHKIEQWRGDVSCIGRHITTSLSLPGMKRRVGGLQDT